MRIGVPTEIKPDEARVALTPAGAQELVSRGHEVIVQTGAGTGSGLTDQEYVDAGASLEPHARTLWAASELVVKVKEPVESEYALFRDDLTLFTFLHLAADEPLTRALVDAGTTALGYETVQLPDGRLPLLAPMSEVAGRLAPIMGATTLTSPAGGRGLLVPGVPGVPGAEVVVLGGGVAGSNAVAVAVGLGARVTVFDTSLPRLRELDALYAGRVATAYSSARGIAHAVDSADLVIGSVLIPGSRAPKLVTDDMVERMRPGSVLVDIAVDQGGCFEHSRPTTHHDPTFRVHETVYYCVANMPGAVPATSTAALTNATLPYVIRLADAGVTEALGLDPAFARGVNVAGGAVVSEPVAAAHGMTARPLAA